MFSHHRLVHRPGRKKEFAWRDEYLCSTGYIQRVGLRIPLRQPAPRTVIKCGALCVMGSAVAIQGAALWLLFEDIDDAHADYRESGP